MLSNPVEIVAKCFYDCCYNQVSEYQYETVDWFNYRQALRTNPNEDKMLHTKHQSGKIREDMLRIIAMFPQTFSDTSCGFGGVGGQAFTEAYIVIIECIETSEIFVYSSGRLLYKLDSRKIEPIFYADVRSNTMAHRGKQTSRYIKE